MDRFRERKLEALRAAIKIGLVKNKEAAEYAIATTLATEPEDDEITKLSNKLADALNADGIPYELQEDILSMSLSEFYKDVQEKSPNAVPHKMIRAAYRMVYSCLKIELSEDEIDMLIPPDFAQQLNDWVARLREDYDVGE